MNAAAATQYVRQMAEHETRGFGDDDNALRRLSKDSRISFWTLKYLKQGRATKVDADLLSQIKDFYIAYCERLILSVQSNLENARATRADDDFADLMGEVESLASKVARAKAGWLSKGVRP